MSDNGLLPATATHANVGTAYYLSVGLPIVEPLIITAQDRTTNGAIYVDGLASGAYQGAVNIVPGANTISATEAAGLTIRTGAGAKTIVEVGTNTVGGNELFIAGTSGTSQVYDELYNPAVSLQPVIMVATNPNLTPANPEEILRGTQTAIAAAIATPGSQFNVFSVPKTGAYTIQTEIFLGNAGAVNTVVIPSVLVGGVPVWESISLSFQIQGTSTPVPYASFEVLGGDFYGTQAFANQNGVSKTFTSVAFLTAGTNYAITLGAGAGYNIGDGGQIKCELIAMC